MTEESIPLEPSTLAMVQEFMTTFKQVVNESPRIANDQLNLLRIRLLEEELEKLIHSLAYRDKLGTLDAMCNLQYVLDGAFLALGFADVKSAAMKEVHRSNMSKVGDDGKPVFRADGKVLKGSKFTKPNLAQFIK